MNIQKLFSGGMTYGEYRNVIDQLLMEGKTTGNSQTAELTEYTKLNVQRMSRIDKTLILPPGIPEALRTLGSPVVWLVAGEAWCGDCAQVIPVLNKMAAASNGNVELSIVSRDHAPELVEKYNTMSIPKLLMAPKSTMKVEQVWGPRPLPAREIMLEWKGSNGKISKHDFEKKLHLWYARDKGATIIDEVINMVKTLRHVPAYSVHPDAA